MNNKISNLIIREVKSLFELKETERLWHIPMLATLCVGVPLLTGFYFNKLDYGILSSIGGLVILYLPLTSVANRMITLITCSFGLLVSLAIGICFSFNPFISSMILGLFSIGINWITNYFDMKSPKSFFFIMLASIACCMPFNLATIPTRIGLIALGTMFACILAFFYSLFIVKKYPPQKEISTIKKSNYANLIESSIIGIFIGISLLIGNILHLDNPYWLPISCASVIQGVSLRHIWQRSIQRIVGTYLGLGLTGLLLLFNLTPLSICISILILQFIIEILVVRHYGLAVIFITPMTLFLAEASHAMTTNPNNLLAARLIDIVLGSLIGMIGGWFLHRQLYNEDIVKNS